MTNPGARKISLITNTIFSLLSWFLPIIIGFIATPLIVKSLGNRDYGLYAVILGFISYSFTFGIGKVLMKYIAEYRATGQSDKIGEVVSATFWLSLVIALAGTLLVALTARYIVADLLYLPEEQQEVGVTGLYLACAAIIATMLSQTFQFILQGLNRFGSYLLLTNISGVVLNIGNVGLALLGYGITTLLTWNFIAMCVMAAAFGFDAVRNLPEFSLRLNIHSKAWPAVLRYGSNIILYQIFGNVLLAFERAWIVRKFGPEAATFYLVPMTLAIYLHGIVGSSILVLFPLVNELLTDRARLIAVYEKATKMMIALIMFLSIALIFGGKPLLLVWMNAEIANRSYPILVIHTLTFALTASIMVVWQLADGFRAPGFNTVISFIWMIVAIPLMVLTADKFGTEGVAVSRLAGVILTMPFLFVVERRFLGRQLWGFWWTTAWKISAASVATILVCVGYLHFVEPKWPFVLAGFALSGLVFGISLLVSGFFTLDERELFGKMLSRLFGQE